MRKMKSKNRVLLTGIFELFGNYCDESAYDVRRLLVKWLENRLNEYAEYFRIPLRHKNLTMEGWLMQVNDDTQPGDELCIYALSRMFNCHVFIYTKHGYWSTHVLNVRAAEADVRKKCDITLVYAEPLVFGEIKKIKKPISLPLSIKLDTTLRSPTKTGVQKAADVKNFERKHPLDKFGKKRKQTDWSDPTKTTTMTLPPPPKQSIIMPTDSDNDTPTHSYTLRTRKKQEVMRCNPRLARSTSTNVNYSNMNTSSERASPPRKCKPANLMRYPSATVISAHKRMKENSKKTGKLNKESTNADEHNTESEDKTISDNKSTDTTINNNNNEKTVADNTKSNNNIGNTNSDNRPVRETEEATNSNNNITKSDNNNNEIINPVSSHKTSTAPILIITQNQDTPAPDTGTEVHLTTTTVDQHPQQPVGSTDFTNLQENDTNQQPTDIPETVNLTVNATLDALQGKTTPEKIAIETLLNMGDSMEHDDPDLDENALLMPVDRPPDIPIEPKGIIPTQPVNPELPPEPKSDTPPHSKGNDTDSTEILETGKLGNTTEGQQETPEAKTTSKKKKKKVKKTVRKNKKKKTTRTTQSVTSEENKDVKQDPKPVKKGKLITQTFVLKRGYKP